MAFKRDALRGIFWILDNGAKGKDLPRQFGSNSAVHRRFTTWVKAGVFERLMRDAGRCVEERGGYRRRWTVERTILWFQNFRRLCIRWEKPSTLFQGFLHLSCSILLLREALG